MVNPIGAATGMIGTAGIGAYAARPKAEDAAGPSFNAMVAGLVDTARSAGAAAEAESAETVAGTGDMVKTAVAVNSAEVAMDVLVATRDRMVAAYNDVIRMQI